MATIDLLRRRIEMAQAKADEYEGVVLGTFNNLGNGRVPSVAEGIMAVSPEITIPDGCSVVQLHTADSSNAFSRYVVLDENGICVAQSQFIGTRNLNVPSGRVKVRIACNIDNIDDFYVKDNTNNVYLWKGKNV